MPSGVLSDQRVSEYQKKGYVVAKRYFDEGEMGLLRRAAKEDRQDALQGGATGGFPRGARLIHVAGAVATVLDVSFLFQNPQQGANRGITGWIGQRRQHFRGGGLLARVQDVHDLALAPAEMMFSIHVKVLKL